MSDKLMDLNNLSREEAEFISRVTNFQRNRFRGLSSFERNALLGTALGGIGVVAGGAAVDQFLGDANALNSGELAANIPLAALPIGTGVLGAYFGNASLSPEARQQAVQESVDEAKKNLKGDARAYGYDYAQQRFADAKNLAIEEGFTNRNRRALGGLAGGVLLGGAASLTAMRDTPQAQTAMEAIPPEKAAEIELLLRANGAR